MASGFCTIAGLSICGVLNRAIIRTKFRDVREWEPWGRRRPDMKLMIVALIAPPSHPAH